MGWRVLQEGRLFLRVGVPKHARDIRESIVASITRSFISLIEKSCLTSFIRTSIYVSVKDS